LLRIVYPFQIIYDPCKVMYAYASHLSLSRNRDGLLYHVFLAYEKINANALVTDIFLLTEDGHRRTMVLITFFRRFVWKTVLCRSGCNLCRRNLSA
jgi:hypothetical protein